MIDIHPFRGQVADRVTQDFVNKSTHVWEVCIDGHHIGIWGLMTQTFLSDRAYIWFTHDDINIQRHRHEFSRFSRDVFAAMLVRYPIICGHCVEPKSMRWLRWIGATFIQIRPDLFEFELRAK